MTLKTYTLSESGERQPIELNGNLFVELGNGSSLELIIDDLQQSTDRQALPIFSRVTGQEQNETPESLSFSSLSITPSACNVIEVSAQVHIKSGTE